MIIAISTPKGGVGKSTIAYHLARMLNEKSKSLLVDIDPQGNSTRHLLGERELNDINNIRLLFEKKTPVTIEYDSLDILGANITLADCEKVASFETYFLLQEYLGKMTKCQLPLSLQLSGS